MPASVTGTRALLDSAPMARDDRSAGEAWLAGEFVGMQQLLAREGYADLRSDVDGELPAFEDAFGAVSSLYGRLPW